MREYTTTFLLPRRDLSAREAFTMLQASPDTTIRGIFEAGQLLEVGTSGTSTPEGRAGRIGGWSFRFKSPSGEGALINTHSGGIIQAVWSSSRPMWRTDVIGNSVPWVDSIDAGKAAADAPSEKYDQITSASFSLICSEGRPLWVVTRRSIDNKRKTEKTHEIVVDGIDASLVAEHIRYSRLGKVLRSQTKIRVGTCWEDWLPPS